MIRQIILIDEERCDGCGLCVPACAEGAIQIIDGKARLVSDRLCDGLGACLGECPQDALHIEDRDADDYDESAVTAHLEHLAGQHPGTVTTAADRVSQTSAQPPRPSPLPSGPMGPPPGGCPSARFASFEGPSPCAGPAAACDGTPENGRQEPSALTHWPIQLRLLPPSAPMLRGASLLLSADCVPFALPDFHSRMLRGRAVAIACPKLDETGTYVEKLTEMIRLNEPAEITIAHMEVPCCTGLLMMALEARQRSGKPVRIIDVVVGTRGDLLSQREIPCEANAATEFYG